MNCRRVSSLISAYMDGELTGVEMLQIRRHLDDCPACTSQYESLRSTKQLLSRLPYPEPRPGLAQALCARLDSIEIPAYQKLWHRIAVYGRQRMSPVPASCVALGAVLIFLMLHAVKGPDIVALHRPPIYAGAIRLPATALIPATRVTFASESPRLLPPDTVREGTDDSGIFRPIRLEGN